MGILIKKIIKMALAGSDGIQLNKKQDYKEYVPYSAKQLSEENWNRVGSALRIAMNKVGGQYGKIQ